MVCVCILTPLIIVLAVVAAQSFGLFQAKLSPPSSLGNVVADRAQLHALTAAPAPSLFPANICAGAAGAVFSHGALDILYVSSVNHSQNLIRLKVPTVWLDSNPLI
jgi:hypothetical protein